MINKEICSVNLCTGCGACMDVCPQQCIKLKPDSLGALHPIVDFQSCINCNLCVKTCPNNINLEFHKSQTVYASWSLDNKVRLTSASGGLAFEFYRYWLCKGGVAAGVELDSKGFCQFIILKNQSDLLKTQNSKYTFSNTNGIYKIVKEYLEKDIPVLFIGTPCQVAGLYGFLKKKYSLLTTVDLICHGMPPGEYFQQHVSFVEKNNSKHKTKFICFRDPIYYTYTFTFTFTNEAGKSFYKKTVRSLDNYQLGYHHALIYRNNCYVCRYAQAKRISDITIGDFSGLGRFAPYTNEKRNVSCVLINTQQGRTLFNAIKQFVYFEERPSEEAFKIERQLQSPSVPHPKRNVFVKKFSETQDFELASNAALRKDKLNVLLRKGLWKRDIRRLLALIFPEKMIQLILHKLRD